MLNRSNYRAVLPATFLAAMSVISVNSSSVSLAQEKKASPEDLASRAKEIFRARCHECHNEDYAEEDVVILDREVLLKLKKVEPGKPEASRLYELITVSKSKPMPPEDYPRLSDEEKEAIHQWIAAGAPDFPKDVEAPAEEKKDPGLEDVAGVDYVLKTILSHVQQLPSRNRPFYRYFSAHHLTTGGVTPQQLEVERDALAKAINHLSTQPQIVRPEALDPKVNTIFAVDIRRLGWHQRPFQLWEHGRAAGAARLNLFDVALLEYPYAVIYEDSETYDRLLEQYMAPAGMVRPIPFVRSDWFVSVVTQPPLYEDMLRLPFELDELEEQLGVDCEANLRDFLCKRAGMSISGVSRNNRVVERHPFRHGAYWKSFDFASSKGRQNMFHNPLVMDEDGGEFIFNLPNGLQAYYVADATGRRIDAAPTSIVTDRLAADKTVRNGLSCMRCHDQGMKTFTDKIRPALEKLPGSPGFSKRDALELYPVKEAMDELVQHDKDRFIKALEKALGKPQNDEPLTLVSQRFLDTALSLTTSSGELGLADPNELAGVFRSRSFFALGLMPLAARGVVRRDMWEDYYDDIVRQLGLGVPVAPLDGVTLTDYEVQPAPFEVQLSTSGKNNVFAAGDDLVVFVANRSSRDLHIELIGASAKGRRVILTPPGTVVKGGERHRFPAQGAIRIQPTVGKEQITLFASDKPFPPARLLRGKGLADRVIHRFYEPRLLQENGRLNFDPSRIVKKTIAIETR